MAESQVVNKFTARYSAWSETSQPDKERAASQRRSVGYAAQPCLL